MAAVTVVANGWPVQWLAVASANDPFGGRSRIDHILNAGPHGGDTDALSFWADPPGWIAAGPTPGDALRTLFAKNGYDEEATSELFRGPFGSHFHYHVIPQKSSAHARAGYFGLGGRMVRFPIESGYLNLGGKGVPFELTLDAARMGTHDWAAKMRLKGQQFLDAKRFAKIHIQGTTLVQTGPKTGTMIGTIRLRGVTCAAAFDLRFRKAIETIGREPFHITVTAGIDRHAFGMTLPSLTVRRLITFRIDAAFQPSA